MTALDAATTTDLDATTTARSAITIGITNQETTTANREIMIDLRVTTIGHHETTTDPRVTMTNPSETTKIETTIDQIGITTALQEIETTETTMREIEGGTGGTTMTTINQGMTKTKMEIGPRREKETGMEIKEEIGVGIKRLTEAETKMVMETEEIHMNEEKYRDKDG